MKPRVRPETRRELEPEPELNDEFWFLNVSYDLDKHDISVMDRRIEQVAGRECSGAGVSFGSHARDMDWMFTSREVAFAMQARLEEAKLDITIHGITRG